MKKILTILFLLIATLAYSQDKPDLSPIEAYKPIYFIFGNERDQVKVQLSFKYNLFKQYNWGLFLGYGQYMDWMLYNNSSPFKEINYNPEVFIKRKEGLPKWVDYIQLAPYEHMSNGRDGADSRSIDRTYLQAQISYGKKINIGLNLKGMIYYSTEDKNKSYPRYTKYYEAKVFASFGEQVEENAKDEIYFKCSGWQKGYHEYGYISRKLSFMNPRIYIQVFDGYLGNMLEYREKETQIRAGVMLK